MARVDVAGITASKGNARLCGIAWVRVTGSAKRAPLVTPSQSMIGKLTYLQRVTMNWNKEKIVGVIVSLAMWLALIYLIMHL